MKLSKLVTLWCLCAIPLACASQNKSTDKNSLGDSGGGVPTVLPGDLSGDPALPGDTNTVIPVEQVPLSVVSFPAPATTSESAYQYKVTLNKAGDALFALARGPSGATITGNGAIRWEPGAAELAGDYDFEVAVFFGEERINHTFTVHMSTVEVETTSEIDAGAESTTTVSVDSPLSTISGSSVIIPPDAMQDGGSISIGVVDKPADLPALEQGEQPTVVDFGPSGTVFAEPVSLVIPLSDTTLASIQDGKNLPEAWTFGESGAWERLDIENVDLDSGTAVIKTRHFSQFTVIGASAVIEASKIATGAAQCSSSLYVKLGVLRALEEFKGTWVNGLPTDWQTDDLRTILNKLSAEQSVQLVLYVEATTAEGARIGSRSTTISIKRNVEDSNFTIVVADSSGAELLRFEGVGLETDGLRAALNGSLRYHVFDQAELQSGARGRIDYNAYAYFRPAGGGLASPPAAGFTFAAGSADYDTLSAVDDDDDCDGLSNPYDPTPTGVPPPRLGAAEASLRTVVSVPVDLVALLNIDDVDGTTVTWVEPSGLSTLKPTPAAADGTIRASFSSELSGLHNVRVVATNAGGSSEILFSVVVDKPDLLNTPPSCQIAASVTSAFVGDSISLLAIPTDAEQTDTELRVRWLINQGTLANTTGRDNSFTAERAGEFQVLCTPDDGVDVGEPAFVVISVVERPQNIPPRLVYVTPLSKTIEVDAGAVARVSIQAFAEDTDGDAISYEMTLLEGDAVLKEGVLLTRGVYSRTLLASKEGAYAVLVRASDTNGALSDSMVVNIFVTQTITEVDDDGDGFPDGMDCDDSDATIFPGAEDICGDGIDQNCSGEDKPAGSCDVDRDGFTVDDGDCNDNDAGVHPKAFDACNGRDDNCNDIVDDGYDVGLDCSVGVGACFGAGKTICSASGLAVACAAVPKAPTAEVCNGTDNDCNGVVDDVPQGTTAVQDVDNCGGCGVACNAQSNEVASCEQLATGNIGCVYTCTPGALDLDGDSSNGCEYSCSPTNGGTEICDGIDNDCDGKVDEDTDDYYYTGAQGTLGVGVCRRGRKICVNGSLQNDVPEVAPETELCDGLDNNCDGQTDEGYAIGVVCDSDDSDLCAMGISTCALDGSGVVCTNESFTNALDICDGFDNDCNPSTPDGQDDSGLGVACDGADADRCLEGSQVCQSGALFCTDNTGDKQDLCDGLDNDCDPDTPDGAHEQLLGLACDGDDADLCAKGLYVCGASGLECSDTVGESVEVCDGSGVDADCDGTVGCADSDCASSVFCTPEVCDDGIDNNNDGLLDCADQTCMGTPNCPWPPESCFDGQDNDGDGATDCADSDCATENACGAEVCDDDFDNDGDGSRDCADPDCSGVPPCGPEVCTDLIDNDGDALLDCDDTDCAGSPACVGGPGLIGVACTSHNDCSASDGDPVCVGELGPGFPSGYCSEFCDLGLDDCPTGSMCMDVGFGSGRGVCFDDCADQTECREADGYGCAPFEDPKGGPPPADNSGPTVCLPMCTSDSQCLSAGYCDVNRGKCTDAIEICGNGIDDNNDGRFDCGDFVCVEDPSCLGGGELCTGGVDDDGDGATDCEDPDCWGDPSCGPPPGGEDCFNGVDDNADGMVDCADSMCMTIPECLDIGGEICGDGIDNDTDGMVDCQDPECWPDPSCGPPPPAEDCKDGIDNNGDGFVDCADPLCLGGAICSDIGGEICGDGIDNDTDGFIDCQDMECWPDPSCGPPPGGEDCFNGVDDNADGMVDCADSMCMTIPECLDIGGEICGDGIDNDTDGMVDCQDPECWPDPSCGPPPPAEDCKDGIDNNGDGFVDCADPLCLGGAVCSDIGGEICGDGIDNDTDGFVDCQDMECWPDPSCGPPPGGEDCFNGIDDNADGMVDCADSMCMTIPECLDIGGEICGDGIDNDTDGMVDCQDPECWPDPSCGPPPPAEDCKDGIDNNGDGFVDCADPLCLGGPVCSDIGGEICGDGVDNDTDGFVDCQDMECWPDPSCGPPPGGEDCFNGIDDNADGMVDCADSMCMTIPECLDIGGEICGDGIDNDTDGMVDCQDPECWPDPSCGPPPPAEDCKDGIDNNGDGFVDCADPLCLGGAVCSDIGGEICGDGIDNDTDGFVDCQDMECWPDPSCGPPPGGEDCFNGVDDNADGMVDCADSMCMTIPECLDIGGEICGDGIDNDTDGFVDCQDMECWPDPSCGPPPPAEDCKDGIDNNGDGFVDCADPLCLGGAVCSDIGGEICGDGVDNDTDGFVDCQDMECWPDPSCGPPPGGEDCFNGVDDNADGMVDCADSMCMTIPECLDIGGEICGDGIDNDTDRMVDCQDPECWPDPSCGPPPPAEDCKDGIDNDGDGFVDCADPLCLGGPVCSDVGGETCGDGIDNDTDGFVDCQDMECWPDPSCGPPPGGEDCFNGVDDNADGMVDCADSMCMTIPECLDIGGEICGDGIDNDTDGMVDCQDPECWPDPSCGPPPPAEDCADGVDNDGDLLIDCADSDCVGVGYCGPEVCDDEQDNDGDGSSDCADTDCTTFPLCGAENCGDSFDNDGDAYMDCEDTDCAADPVCLPGLGAVGTSCTIHSDCAAQNGLPVCAGEIERGFPAGYCSEFCDLAANNCPAGSTCVDVSLASGNGVCFDDCQDPSACRTAYDCQPFAGTGPLVCSAACISDTDCPAAGYCDPNEGSCSTTVEICSDGIDNDANGRLDCGDLRCSTDPSCFGGAEICNNQMDDDGDGAYDCADPDCDGIAPCTDLPGEVCGDGIDNDTDAMIDCQDPECWPDPICN